MAQETFSIQNLLRHRTILVSLGIVIVIGLVSFAYYVASTKKPETVVLPASTALSEDVTASGTVEPLQNPNLFFVSSGRITYVGVKVGDRVYAGETLATLDTSTLSASRAQAEANLSAQEAKLNGLKAGPRSTDIAVRQAAVDQASQAKANAYADLSASVADAFAKGEDAVYVSADPLFSNAHTSNPSLVFTVSDSNIGQAAIAARVSAGTELVTWQGELAALGTSPSDADLDQALGKALQHLSSIRSFEDSMASALSVAVPNTSFTSSSITSATAAIGGARASMNAEISALTAKRQAIISDTLAINAAQAQLDQLTAGASAQDIAQQEAAVSSAAAAVRAVDAQIANNVIIAPFSGTVGSLSIKRGDLAVPNIPAITLDPNVTLQVSVFVSEIDAARIHAGDAASVTLDAYGNARTFPAHVAEVSTAPSKINGTDAYEVKLTFDASDRSIQTGMTANAIIHTHSSSQ
ncbi:MAG: HlyD family efflux transporter periplasmic adaptor subunit [Patescibacteria group bacterium]|nr:HlyD family efflux transporter periplasmic adaptor subunit [Patescibacteria group bacterium]